MPEELTFDDPKYPEKYLGPSISNLNSLVEKKVLVIPQHQRDYSWGKDELKNLMDDIEELRKNPDLKENKAKPHFFGAMVFKNLNSSDGDCEKYSIIDGQQRLVSSMLLLDTLKEFVLRLKDDCFEECTQLINRIDAFLYMNLHRIGKKKPRLILNRGDDFFTKLIMTKNINEKKEIFDKHKIGAHKDVHKNIYNAGKFFHEILSEKLDKFENNDLIKQIISYLDTIQFMFSVLELRVSNDSDAYTIFETLNKRGKDLSEADLIKNLLISKAEREGASEDIICMWGNMQESLSEYGERITDFLTYNYNSRRGYLKNKGKLFENVKGYITSLEGSVNLYTKGFNEDRENYMKLKGHTSDDGLFIDDVTEQLLKELRNRIKVTRVYPLLLAARAKVDDKSEFQRLVKNIINFAFRYKTVSGNSADSLLNIISKSSKDLHDGKTDVKKISQLLYDECTDGEFIEKFKKFEPSNNYTAYYTLWKIEEYLAGKKAYEIKPYPQSIMQHLEHIMPQTPDCDEWSYLFKDGIEDERSATYKYRIGNLLILEGYINASIKNKGFKYKNSNESEKDYKHSKLELPKKAEKFLNDEGTWVYESIQKRSDDLAEIAKEVWKIKF